MWASQIDDLDQGRLSRATILRDGRQASYAEVVDGWRSEAVFRDAFIALLADAPHDAYLWETPPLTTATAQRGFEFVLVDSPALAEMRLDPHSFAAHFDAAGDEAEVAAFANLGGDAFLVAPTPRAEPATYAHLAAFARGAPATQQHAFWQAVGDQMAKRMSDRPLWLSTNGLGVAWLHARLDSRPKYYAHRPYRTVR